VFHLLSSKFAHNRIISILIIALLGAIPLSAMAREGNTIVLHLDDGQNRKQPPYADSEIRPLDECPIIEVPAVSDRPAPLPNVSKAGSVVLMDAETGQVLYQKNAHTRRPNASTTKIMTAILFIENVGMNEWITASKKAAETPYTSIHLKPGERIQAKDLLMAMMIRSANDAAVAIAEHVAGSTAKFAEMMNKKAREIGCKNTHFVTPNGLFDKNHYSSAYDLCLMAKYAFRYPIFNEVVKTRKYVLNSRTTNREDLVVFARHRFMKNYPGADGVKSGYIKQAGYCFVGSATRNGWRLIATVLKSDDAGRDTAAVIDYGFNNFRPYTIAQADLVCASAKIDGGAAEKLPVAPAKDLKIIVPKTGARIVTQLNLKPLQAPITKGTPVGTVSATVNGVEVSRVELRAAEDMGVSIARRIWFLLKTCGLLVAGLSGIGYGTTVAKSACLRRRRVTTSLRRVNRLR